MKDFPAAAAVGNGGGQPVGVGVVGDNQLGADGVCQRLRQIEGAGFFGIGKGYGGETAIGLVLLGHGLRQRQRGSLKGFEQHFAADAVQGGVNVVQRHLGGIDALGGGADIAVDAAFV